MFGKLGIDTEVTWVKADQLLIDRRYQRAVNPRHVEYLVRNFDQVGLTIMNVSRRADGLYVLDGQHRLLAIKEQSLDHLQVRCSIYSGLSFEQERRLFLLFNRNHLPLSTRDAFAARLASPDVKTEFIQDTLAQLGLTLVPPGQALGVREISAWAYLEELDETGDLQRVLSVVMAGWGKQPGAFKRLYLEVIARLLRDNISQERIIRMLQKTPPTALDREALSRQDGPGVQLGSYLRACRDMLHDEAVP